MTSNIPLNLSPRSRRLIAVILLFASPAFSQSTRPAPDPARYEKEIQKFEAADAAQMPAQNGVVFVGSSSIRIWKTDKAFPDVPTINRGFGGSHVADSVFYAPRIILKYKPRVVVFYAGDNDLAFGLPVEKVKADVEKLATLIHEQSKDTKLILIAAKPSPSRWKLWPRFQAFNASLESYAKSHPNTEFLDITKEMLTPTGDPSPDLFRSDKLHMNEKGYEIWNRALAPHLQ